VSYQDHHDVEAKQERIEALKARIAALEAALREIAIYDANITKTLREVLK